MASLPAKSEGKKMYKKALFIALLFSCCGVAAAAESFTATYGSLVDDAGNISLPKDYRSDWTFLGAWSIAQKDVADGQGAAGLHNVYTQPGVAEYFGENGSFPDGAVLVKELFKTVTAPMSTGTVSRAGEVEGWFVMVKDTQGRFMASQLWGDGWGWAFFAADQPEKTVTKDYKTECIGCHIPAREDDWIYVSGYPVLTD